ncbi:MAG: rhodanese-like domain-containing protein [Sandaracinaceae bacterium]|nr:rhodanese-like domain-containing protein [Sandaracinaceae bacterium]
MAATWLAANHCRVRILDVREGEEFTGDLGHIEGAEWLPLADLEHVGATLPTDEPIVVVCRSGRRSMDAARALRHLGLPHVAHLAGGMLAWHDFGLPVAHGAQPPLAATDVLVPHGHAEEHYDRVVSQALTDSGAIVWTSASSLLSAGTLSCIDGRSERAVIGSPGGDAGELILALAAFERLADHPIDLAHIPDFFEHWASAFGRFYLHTDIHALERLREALREDPRFAALAHELETDAQMESFVRHPPRALEAPLIEHMLAPAHMGCGHLRLMLQHPDAYGVRPAMVTALLAAGLRHGWRRPGSIHFEVLAGDHAERAVVEILFDRPVAAYTRVAMLVPRGVLGEAFVLHPQVVTYVRHETSGFLVENAARLGIPHVDRARLVAEIDRLGDVQLAETVGHLGATLPRLVMRVSDSGFVVRDADAAD